MAFGDDRRDKMIDDTASNFAALLTRLDKAGIAYEVDIYGDDSPMSRSVEIDGIKGGRSQWASVDANPLGWGIGRYDEDGSKYMPFNTGDLNRIVATIVAHVA